MVSQSQALAAIQKQVGPGIPFGDSICMSAKSISGQISLKWLPSCIQPYNAEYILGSIKFFRN